MESLKDILLILFALFLIGGIFIVIPALLISPFLRLIGIFSTKQSTRRILSTIIVVGAWIILIVNNIIEIPMGCYGPPGEPPIVIMNGIEGKIVIDSPDTLNIFEKDKIVVRIGKLSLNQNVFLTKLNQGSKRILVTDTLLLRSSMRVAVKEIFEEGKVEIARLNNNERQFVDTSNYSEWIFDIKGIDYGTATLIVSISGLVSSEFGIDEIDCPIYEKKIFVAASPIQRFRLYCRKNYWLAILIIVGAYLIIYKLIPKQTIIEYYMPNSKRTNFWSAGALGLVVYVMTLSSLIVFKILDINLIYVLLVFVGTVLIYSVFTAVSLRDNNKLSQKNFLQLMTLAIKKLPPLNVIFGDKKT